MPGIDQPKGLAAGRTEATAPPAGLVELLHFDPLDGQDGDDRQLGDPFAPLESHRFRPVVYQKDTHLTAISGVDEPGAVDDAYSMTSSVTGTGQDEAGIPSGDGDGDPGGHGSSLTRVEDDLDSAMKIDSGIADMSVAGNWQFPIETYEVNLHGVQGHRAG